MVRQKGTKLVIEIEALTEDGVAGELEMLHKALTGMLMSLDEDMLYKE